MGSINKKNISKRHDDIDQQAATSYHAEGCSQRVGKLQILDIL